MHSVAMLIKKKKAKRLEEMKRDEKERAKESEEKAAARKSRKGLKKGTERDKVAAWRPVPTRSQLFYTVLFTRRQLRTAAPAMYIGRINMFIPRENVLRGVVVQECGREHILTTTTLNCTVISERQRVYNSIGDTPNRYTR